MNILIDRLPESVEIGGVEYRINTGVRTSILFELLVRNKKIPDQGKIYGMLRLYYPRIPADRDEAIRKALWFFYCGKTGKSIRKNATRQPKISGRIKSCTLLKRIRQVLHIRGKSTSGLARKDVKRINELKKLYALDDEVSVDGRVALAKRNAEMKEYVRRRMEEVKRRVGT